MTDSLNDNFLTAQNCKSPLQNIKAIEQSLMIMKRKISQMNKRQNQNAQQIQKIFYSSIPILDKKLTQSMQQHKFLQKKKINFNQNILKQQTLKNKQKRMINQKEIQRNRELISMIKINDRNTIKQLSKKNHTYIQKMKNYHVQQNRQKRQLVKSRMEHSRMKVNDFRINKLEEIKRQKLQDSQQIEKKKQLMLNQMSSLVDKQNQVMQNVSKSEELLRQLRFAIDKMNKMSQVEFIRMRNQIRLQDPGLAEQRLFERILVTVIKNEKAKIVSDKSPPKSQHLSRSMHSSKGQLKYLL